MQYLNSLFGDVKPLTIAGLVLAVIVALVLVVILVRVVTSRRLRPTGGRSRQPRRPSTAPMRRVTKSLA